MILIAKNAQGRGNRRLRWGANWRKLREESICYELAWEGKRGQAPRSVAEGGRSRRPEAGGSSCTDSKRI